MRNVAAAAAGLDPSERSSARADHHRTRWRRRSLFFVADDVAGPFQRVVEHRAHVVAELVGHVARKPVWERRLLVQVGADVDPSSLHKVSSEPAAIGLSRDSREVLREVS